ncbi:cell division protein FtsQ/DivIB [Bradyrhizobium sp. U87765 SZCCT0131]|uniref:cell division protein FtsQ/DivIB n=1 Tax=unclassified Bradyrhizobium TaxID=2631580 RepID=UPI001BA4534A|nr:MULTISPECIES: cell division protein FtsQ/DivIB [unclassified Bradyrhizobium]MBR1218367.1 cell division protein FtsQ/DivIB [Bradyrhizobium sp. U87765 SZCCT0131]MBR1260687.1 cell division protein FtsQ/DivIB [Bradyrhizobium sp. U87765 SZCCT0134]MBR1303865.1 cell division protein FtsQ/DivIB [Bradyrhizobium sp. U87765 SZCCT0110]MBR1319471.1 cell division protein FtsQ/DivIB [Bradyrhizobium sp. U87765 SZCCT0109]MBR1347796.1 cell division protein FtsQ/DivIB [Bradyrhizobium sp. U87765 SZCCT0048]
MDGGGRLVRSQGQPRPQSESTKTTARRPAPRSSRAASRPPRSSYRAPANSENLPRFLAALQQRLPRRFGWLATLVILLASLAFGVVKGNHVEEFVTALSDTRNAAANAVGFRITNVAISGRKQLTQDEVLAVGGVTGRSSLLFLDAATVRDRLKASPWIADATVLKLYPGQLQIDITERKAFALWQQDGALSVIADDGQILEPWVSRRFTSLPLVVGKGAGPRAREFLALLDQYPQVRAAVKAVVLVGERRWNLRLADGLDVRLPETNLEQSLALLSKLDKEDHLFSRDITAIDLRLPDRVTVRLSEDAAKAREELVKDKKNKRKGTDA